MATEKKTRVKWCLVSNCDVSSENSPQKTFIHVPKDLERRNSWLRTIGMNPETFSKRNEIFICEDHFNLQDDMENFMEWKLTGCRKLMKKTVVPHKNLTNQSTVVHDVPTSVSMYESKKPKLELTEELNYGSPYITSPSRKQNVEPCSSDYQLTRNTPRSSTKHYRSKKIQVTVQTVTRSCSPIEISPNSSPLQVNFKSAFLEKPLSFMPRHPLFASSQDSSGKSSISLYAPTSNSETPEEFEIENFSNLELKITLKHIQHNPKRYIGIPKKYISIIDYIKNYTKLSNISILLCLKKIRTAHTLAELSDDFATSESSATSMFTNCVTVLSNTIKELISFSKREVIQDNMPIPFRVQFANVSCMISCFEIEIQKPSDPVEQALTWSEYKKANTVKYLIAATPDGVICFISKAFGGRTSDDVVVEECGFLKKLEPGSAVMADRCFKHIEHLLVQRNCTLVQPPSVSSGEKLAKEQIILNKWVASLRIHIERVIRRVREFKLLGPHACIQKKLLPLIDHITVIACGLANLQGPIINQKLC